jgi:hypothetical protein
MITLSSRAKRGIRTCSSLALLGMTCVALAGAQTSAPPPPVYTGPLTAADSGIQIVLLTMGPGDALYELFGHNAIWVRDPASPIEVVYNWGVFDFSTPGFLPRFMLGDMRYVMDGETIASTLTRYRYLNRRVWAQELNLTAAEKRALVDFIRWNALPENVQYRYNYYLDNCSTRVRDAIDRVIGGRLRDHLRGIQTDETYRGHSLRLMQEQKLLVSGVEMALGRPTDVKLTADQASFLPTQLQQHIRGVKLGNGAPLVLSERLLSEAARPAEFEHVPELWKGLLPIGLVVAGSLAFLFFGASRPRTAGVLVAIFAGLFGLLGTIITLLVTITDHVAAHANENMFMLNPLWLVVAVAVPLLLFRGKARAVARWSAVAGAGLAACAVLIHLIGMSRQPNWDVIGLVLPIQLAIAAIAWRRSASVG